jgi:hypothetical protein
VQKTMNANVESRVERMMTAARGYRCPTLPTAGGSGGSLRDDEQPQTSVAEVELTKNRSAISMLWTTVHKTLT